MGLRLLIFLLISILYGCGTSPERSVLPPGDLDVPAPAPAWKPTHITATSDAVFYVGSSDSIRDLYVLEPGHAPRRLLTNAQIALTEAQGVDRLTILDSGTHVLVLLDGRPHVHTRALGRFAAVGTGSAQGAALAPDGAHVALSQGGTVVIEALIDTSRSLAEATLDDTPAARHLITIPGHHCGADDETPGLWWSPDGQSLLFRCIDPADATRTARLLHSRGEKIKEIKWFRGTLPTLVRVVWSPQAPPLLVVSDRQGAVEVLRAHLDTGQTTPLLAAPDAAAIDLGLPRWLPDGSAFLWAAPCERTHCLELRGGDGQPVRRLTSPPLVLRHVAQVTAEAVFAVVGADPTGLHFARVPLAGGETELLIQLPHPHSVVASSTLAVITEQPEAGPARWWVHTLPADGPLSEPVGELTAPETP